MAYSGDEKLAAVAVFAGVLGGVSFHSLVCGMGFLFEGEGGRY